MTITDDKRVLDLLAKLTYNKNKIIVKGLTAGSKELANQTKCNFRATDIRNKSSMNKGIRYKVDKDYLEAKVHIMGHPLLRIFETGATDRRTKKGYYRGDIRAYRFFASAKSNMSNIVTTMTKTMDAEFNKLEK